MVCRSCLMRSQRSLAGTSSQPLVVTALRPIAINGPRAQGLGRRYLSAAGPCAPASAYTSASIPSPSPSPLGASASASAVASSSRRGRPLSLASTSQRPYATVIPTSHSSTPPPPSVPPLPSSSTPHASSSKPPPRPPVKVIPPSLSAIREEGFLDEDVELLPAQDAWLNITQASIDKLRQIKEKEPAEVVEGGLALRVGVDNGGCHGYQYTMDLTEERGVDDYVMQPEGVDCIPVVVDLISLRLLKGATLHHATELIGSSFQLMDNPQAKQGGSCGCGVSWEAKEDI